MNIVTSVVLPVYNSEDTIDRCLKSILNQIKKVDEIIIINDGSKDRTEKIILQKWQNLLPIKYFKNKNNMGVSYSRNRGINLSSGELILSIDGDDEWRPTHNGEILKLYRNNNNFAIYSTRANYYKEDSTPLYPSKVLSDSSIRKHLMWDNPLVHSAIALKKSYFLKTKGYGAYKVVHDYHLINELLSKGKLSFSNKITVNYFITQGSLSRVNLLVSKRERLFGQLKAISFFWKKYPLNALKILPIILIRFILVR